MRTAEQRSAGAVDPFCEAGGGHGGSGQRRDASASSIACASCGDPWQKGVNSPNRPRCYWCHVVLELRALQAAARCDDGKFMDVWRLVGAAVRRWYVFVVVLALAVLAALAAGNRVQPEFTSSSALLLVPPAQSAAGNPYQDMGTAAQSVSIVLQSSPSRSSLAQQGLSTDYDVKTGTRTPIMGLVVRASSASQAIVWRSVPDGGDFVELAARLQGSPSLVLRALRAADPRDDGVYMDVWRLLGATVRRWYVFVVVLALGVLAAMTAGNRVQPEFTSNSSLLLVSPASVAGGNPYQDLTTAPVGRDRAAEQRNSIAASWSAAVDGLRRQHRQPDAYPRGSRSSRFGAPGDRHR